MEWGHHNLTINILPESTAADRNIHIQEAGRQRKKFSYGHSFISLALSSKKIKRARKCVCIGCIEKIMRQAPFKCKTEASRLLFV
jgi:hypothetical protein